MRLFYSVFAVMGLLLVPSLSVAGAWPQESGQGQIIIKLEPSTADKGFDGNGNGNTASIGKWDTRNVSVYGDYGITKRITVYAKADYQDFKTDSTSYSGLGSVEVGGRATLVKSDTTILAVGAGVEGLGKGRRNDFDQARSKGTEAEVRAYGGKSFKVAGKDAFVDVQVAKRWREKGADQVRVDATVGIKPDPKWLVMTQVYAGQTDKEAWGRAKWVNAEVSLVRHLGTKQDVSVQLGARQTLSGENVPQVKALSLSIWKRF
ncbi:hypothetical protein [Asticcacaulis machinosus]|uniref:Uncharacterized protein n=1 Tax=Asticcacaulis machinosus TaxID=2984211 RepID=A0ABT5HF75_9CAUL|nr:hypothetical protein [Asticcacaulis machinosus]MDC7674909.1 hypothetical protein [Asticcacaulis machinosus]